MTLRTEYVLGVLSVNPLLHSGWYVLAANLTGYRVWSLTWHSRYSLSFLMSSGHFPSFVVLSLAHVLLGVKRSLLELLGCTAVQLD